MLTLNSDATALQAIGYKELLPFLRNECSLDEAVQKLKIETRHYAKRQLSWFRRMSDARMIYVDDYTGINELADDILRQYGTFCNEE